MDTLKKAYDTVVERYFQEKRTRMIAWLVLFSVIALLILSAHFVPERTSWEVGSVCDQDIQSDRYLTFVDEEGTLRKQQEALEGLQDVYKVDLNKFNSITIAELSESFNKLEEIAAAEKEGEPLKTVEKIAMAHDAYDFALEADEWTVLVGMSEHRIQWLYNQGADYAITVMSNGVLQENLENAREKILQSIRNDRYITGAEEKFLLNVMEEMPLYATYVLDQDATEERKADILATVTPEKVVVQKGELVVGKGEVLTERQSAILQQLGYAKSASPVLVILGLILLIAVLIVLVRGFMLHFTPKIYQDEQKVVLLMLLLVGTLFFYDLFLSLSLSTVSERSAQVGYLLPVAMGTMLITILLDVRLGILSNVILALFAGLYTEQASFAVVALLGGLTGCLGVSTLGQRSDISRTAFAIAVVNATAIIGLGMIQSQSFDVILYGVGFGVFNGLISSIFTMGVLPYLETLFGITTSIRLLELANPNQPLLKRLMTEAPGTYHHCIMVGNLGEAAADAIGANGLQVRLGAYYHDIGKLKRPYFFAENQFSGSNPHDNITPQLSTLIITSHVKDGLEMAREENLPPVVLDMIAQHHGDSMVSYFYYKAKDLDENARERDFRYENPKPQTKEAAILMMADTVEAAVRSKKDATPGQIEGFIRTLIKGKLNDGQFDECELTFRDLDQIAVAFTRVINGIYHKRVEYPPQAHLIAEMNVTANEVKKLEAKVENIDLSDVEATCLEETHSIQEIREPQEPEEVQEK